MSDITNTKEFNGFTIHSDIWSWDEGGDVFMLREDKGWVYKFTFECDDPEALTLLKAYIRNKYYAER